MSAHDSKDGRPNLLVAVLALRRLILICEALLRTDLVNRCFKPSRRRRRTEIERGRCDSLAVAGGRLGASWAGLGLGTLRSRPWQERQKEERALSKTLSRRVMWSAPVGSGGDG